MMIKVRLIEEQCGKEQISDSPIYATKITSFVRLLLLIQFCTGTIAENSDNYSLPSSATCPENEPNGFQTQQGNESKWVVYADERFNELIQSTPNTAVAFWRVGTSSTDAFSKIKSRSQLAFESICHGWLNGIAPNQPLMLEGRIFDRRPVALWVFDRQYGILVAKFIYYDPTDYSSVFARQATLVSPLFKPIPSYHSDSKHELYSSCYLDFSTYITIPAHLEITLIQIRNRATEKIWPQKYFGEAGSSVLFESYSLKNINYGRISVERQLSSSVDDQMAALWNKHHIILPHDLHLDAPYFIEFSASSGLVTRDTSGQKSPLPLELDGIAITNISLSQACFGPSSDNDGPPVHLWDGSLLSEANHREEVRKKQMRSLVEYWAILLSLLTLLSLAIYILLKFTTNYRRKRLLRIRNHTQEPGDAIWDFICCLIKPQSQHRVYQAEYFKPNTNLSNQEIDNVQQVQLNLNGITSATNSNYLSNQDPELKQLFRYLDELNKRATAEGVLKPQNLNQIDRNQLRIEHIIGKGAFGSVYEGEYLAKGRFDGEDEENEFHCSKKRDPGVKKVAIKMLADERMHNPDSLRDFADEALILASTSHRNIVQLIGVGFISKPLYIVMELMSGGNLKKFLLNKSKEAQKQFESSQLQSNDDIIDRNENIINLTPNRNENKKEFPLSIGELLVFALDIARACDYIQRKNLIHRDLAARNCLLSIGNTDSQQLSFHESTTYNDIDLDQFYPNGYRNSGIVVKLADFGLTRQVDEDANYYLMTMSKEVPVRWMAPECTDYKATSKSDVWSFGIVLWEIFSMGQLPYPNLKDNNEVLGQLRMRRIYGFESNKSNGILETDGGYLIPDDQLAQNERVIRGARLDKPPLPIPRSDLPESIYSIMCSCWSNDPELRPEFSQIAIRLVACLQNFDKELEDSQVSVANAQKNPVITVQEINSNESDLRLSSLN